MIGAANLGAVILDFEDNAASRRRPTIGWSPYPTMSYLLTQNCCELYCFGVTNQTVSWSLSNQIMRCAPIVVQV